MSKHVASVNPEANQELSKSFIIFLITANTMSSLLNIGVNSVLIYIIFRLKLQRKISHRFILCLSISDLCVGIIIQPLLSVRLAVSDPAVLSLIRLVLVFLGITFVQTSGVMTGVIALDRYLHMRHLLYYNSHMTKRRASLLIAATVITSIITSLIVSVGAIYQLTVYVNTCWLSLNIVILGLIVVFYVRAYLSIRNRVADTTCHAASNDQRLRIQRPDIEFVKGMMYILIALLVFYIPYEVTGLMVFFLPTRSEETKLQLQYAYYCCLLFVYLISSYNGIILIMFDGKLRRFFHRNILRRGQTKNSSSAARDTTIYLEDVP